MIDLDAKSFGILRRIFAERAADCQIWAFGSRTDGTARRYSDLDLVFENPAGPLDLRRLRELRDALAESDLPILVDVLDWKTAAPEFRTALEGKLVKFPLADADLR